MTMRLTAHRLAIGVPFGWEARIFRRRGAHAGETNNPVVHLANFPLPEERGDFGGGVTELMVGGDALVVLFEYGSQSRGRPLFAHDGVPRLEASMFSPARLQRTIPGQVGAQVFFSVDGRPFSLYAVIADRRQVHRVVPEINAALDDLEILP